MRRKELAVTEPATIRRESDDAFLSRGGEAVTDAEIICTLMEPNPGEPSASFQESPGGWWIARYVVSTGALKWLCSEKADSLDALHEVEERLIKIQIDGALTYDLALQRENRWSWHATPEQKIKVLAAVLRAGIRTPVEGEKQ